MARLHRRGAVYYALIHVPTDLIDAMGGKKQIWVSLKTKDYADAKRCNAAVQDQWIGTFDDMRRRHDLADADIETAVWQHYTAKVEEGDQERAGRPSATKIKEAEEKATLAAAVADGFVATVNAMADFEILANKADWAARRRNARLNRLRSDLASGDTRLIEIDANGFLAKQGFKIDRAGARYRDLCFKLMRADIEQLERYAERDRGDYSGQPKDQIIAEPKNRSARRPKG